MGKKYLAQIMIEMDANAQDVELMSVLASVVGLNFKIQKNIGEPCQMKFRVVDLGNGAELGTDWGIVVEGGKEDDTNSNTDTNITEWN